MFNFAKEIHILKPYKWTLNDEIMSVEI